jgi:hypothetical protein
MILHGFLQFPQNNSRKVSHTQADDYLQTLPLNYSALILAISDVLVMHTLSPY